MKFTRINKDEIEIEVVSATKETLSTTELERKKEALDKRMVELKAAIKDTDDMIKELKKPWGEGLPN